MRIQSARYRISASMYPVKRTIEVLEQGEADWRKIRVRVHELAAERCDQVLLYTYDETMRRWEYRGKAIPGGFFYDFAGCGPYVFNPTTTTHRLLSDVKALEGGEA